jgi:hypothetical protein
MIKHEQTMAFTTEDLSGPLLSNEERCTWSTYHITECWRNTIN